MKKVIPILLIFILCLQIFDKLCIIFAFQINQEYIIENFCENKDKPLMRCNGKCHLNKQIQSAEEKENQIPQNLKEIFVALYCEATQISSLLLPKYLEIDITQHSFYTNLVVQSHFCDIFHPPQV